MIRQVSVEPGKASVRYYVPLVRNLEKICHRIGVTPRQRFGELYQYHMLTS
jgi:hypothetical protein